MSSYSCRITPKIYEYIYITKHFCLTPKKQRFTNIFCLHCLQQSLEPDLNYASLDLKVANKHKKKHRHQHGHSQGRSNPQDQLPVRLTPPVNASLEVDADMDAQLPSRDTSTMVSHSSIYLNSQQIAQEAEDMERERSINMERENVGWDGIRRLEDGQQESEERKDRQDYSNGSVCKQLSEVEASQSDIFSHNSVQQD